VREFNAALVGMGELTPALLTSACCGHTGDVQGTGPSWTRQATACSSLVSGTEPGWCDAHADR
jgi:hypothetical protein